MRSTKNGKKLINAKVDYLAVINGIYSSEDAATSVLAYNNLFMTYQKDYD